MDFHEWHKQDCPMLTDAGALCTGSVVWPARIKQLAGGRHADMVGRTCRAAFDAAGTPTPEPKSSAAAPPKWLHEKHDNHDGGED